jgi:hypothetical protein
MEMNEKQAKEFLTKARKGTVIHTEITECNDEGLTVNVPAEQIVAVVFSMEGVGFTVTVTANGVPEHVAEFIVAVLIAITLMATPGLSFGLFVA